MDYTGSNLVLGSNTFLSSCYLELFCKQINAIQRRYADVTRTASNTLGLTSLPSKSNSHLGRCPLAIVTCNHTRELVETLLVSNDFFGLHVSQVTILSVDDESTHEQLKESNHVKISSAAQKSFKNVSANFSEVHNVVYESLTARKWVQNGFKWIYFFHEFHALSLRVLPALLGISIDHHLQVNYLGTDRETNDLSSKIFAVLQDCFHDTNDTIFCRRTSLKERQLICLDYSTLQYLISISAAKNEIGNEKHDSSYYHCTENVLFQLDYYTSAYDRNISFHERSLTDRNLGNGTDHLDIMWDYMHSSICSKFGITVAAKWMFISPRDLQITDSSSKAYYPLFSGNFLEKSDTAQYYYLTEVLKFMGVLIQNASDVPETSLTQSNAVASHEDGQIYYAHWASRRPTVVFDSSFGVFPCEIKARFTSPRDVFLSQNASLVVCGNVLLESLQLKGALKLIADSVESKIIVRCGKSDAILNDGYTIRSDWKDIEASKERSFRAHSSYKIAEEVVVAKLGCEIFYTGTHTTRINSATIGDYQDDPRHDRIQECGSDEGGDSYKDSYTCGGCIIDLFFYILFLRR